MAGAAALAILFLSVYEVRAQQQVPAAPAQAEPSAPEAPATPAPSAPVFPKVDPADFTAATPSKDLINSFLQTSWGYDPDRVWQIQGIRKTAVDGLSKVIIVIGDRSGKQKLMALQFFALPDGKHIIAGDDVLPFGSDPYADYRALLQQKADGPYRGAPAKDLELVEFADFQCPHCKEAQAIMDKLVVDYPKARIIYQDYPLEKIHPQSFNASAYGTCVAKLGGSSAFFAYAQAVFDGQEGLLNADGATLTLNSAVAKAGLEPAKVAACAVTPEVKARVEASAQLAQTINVNQTPTLMVNGRQVPLGGMPYETLKKIIDYQMKLDGIK